MDDIWHVWNDLQRKEDDLKWGGHPPGIGAQYDSMGRPAESHSDGGGGWMHEQMGRVERVRRALQDSGPPAHSMIAQTLAGIELSPVWHLLVSACQDIALCYGSSVANGGFIGGAGGRFFGGVGAFAGVASGAAGGVSTQGGWVKALLGLPSLGEGLSHAIADAAHYYTTGFIEAWGPARQGNGYGTADNARGDPSVAAFHIGHGHVIMITAILAALVGYLVKNKDGRAALLAEISHSPRLGPKLAVWVEKNEAALRRHSALQSRGWGAAAEEESSAAVRRQPAGKEVSINNTEPFDEAAFNRIAQDQIANNERYASTVADPRSKWISIARGGQLAPNPDGPDFPPGVLDDGEDYTKHMYTEGKKSFPVVQTARGVYAYPATSLLGDETSGSTMQQVIISGKAEREALLAADAAAAHSSGASASSIPVFPDPMQFAVNRPANTAGQSAMSLSDTQQRMNYHSANEAARDSARATIVEAIAENSPSSATAAAYNASQQRIDNRNFARAGLSKGGLALSMAVDQTMPPKFYFNKYTTPGATEFDVAARVAKGVGSSNGYVNALGALTKVLGPIGVGYGAYSSTANILNASPANRPYVVAQEAGTWVGGWYGASWGMAGSVALAIALGSNPIGWGILAAGAVGGIVGGLAGSYVGAYSAGSAYQGVTSWIHNG